MFKLIIVNLLLFAAFLVLFITAAAGIGYALGAGQHVMPTAIVYVTLMCLHLWLNHRMLRKWQLELAGYRLLSTALVAGLYIIYLIYLFTH